MFKYLLIIFVFLLTVGDSYAQTWEDLPHVNISITKEDLLRTKEGREVKKINDRLRKIAAKADALKKEKGTKDAVDLLQAGFEKLKKHRDRIGEPIRGLKGMNVMLIGDLATNEDQKPIIDGIMRDYVLYDFYKNKYVRDNTVYGYYYFTLFSGDKYYPGFSTDPPSQLRVKLGRLYKDDPEKLMIEEAKPAAGKP